MNQLEFCTGMFIFGILDGFRCDNLGMNDSFGLHGVRRDGYLPSENSIRMLRAKFGLVNMKKKKITTHRVHIAHSRCFNPRIKVSG